MSLDTMLGNNPVCQMLGIRYPVFQAGMGHVAYAALAAAVSEAGGMGVIGAGYMRPDELRAEIRQVRDLTEKPFGVDILFAKVKGPGDSEPRYTDHVKMAVDIAFEERVPVLVSGLGNPGGITKDAHDLGIRVMSVIGKVSQARRLAEGGVDIIVASGRDGGGHVGEVGTATLVPATVDAIDIPVVAGGGLADGRGMLAAMALGASGIWMGTRFIATFEARGHENYKKKIVEITEDGTVVTRAHSGKTCRLVRNDFTEYWEEHADEIEPHPQQLMKVGGPASILGRIEGDVENGVLPAGQSSAMIHGLKPAGDVVRDVIEEARVLMASWAG